MVSWWNSTDWPAEINENSTSKSGFLVSRRISIPTYVRRVQGNFKHRAQIKPASSFFESKNMHEHFHSQLPACHAAKKKIVCLSMLNHRIDKNQEFESTRKYKYRGFRTTLEVIHIIEQDYNDSSVSNFEKNDWPRDPWLSSSKEISTLPFFDSIESSSPTQGDPISHCDGLKSPRKLRCT